MARASRDFSSVLRDSEVSTFEVEGERFVRPDFAGRGLANLAATMPRLLAPSAEMGLPGFDETVLPERLRTGIKNVVVVIADGLGHNQLQREIRNGNAPRLAELIQQTESNYQAITSVFPTTTVSALGAVNSGVAPVD